MSKLRLSIYHPDLDQIKEELLIAIDFYNPLSIILIGSYSRGEHWRGDLNTSDVEFYIIIDKNYSRPNKPVFKYCDVSIIKINKLKYLPKNLINFEAKEMGVIVYGDDLRYLMPTVTISNIDQGIVDEIILFRFLEISHAIVEDKDIDFVMTKNLNYLMTWTLIKDGILLAGFKNRSDYYLNNQTNNITNDLFKNSKNICELIIGARLGNNVMPEGGEDMMNIFEKLFKNYSDLLFKKRTLRSRLTQVFYLVKARDMNFTEKIKQIILSIFISDYRKKLIKGLYHGIINKDFATTFFYIAKCNSYYPFLYEK